MWKSDPQHCAAKNGEETTYTTTLSVQSKFKFYGGYSSSTVVQVVGLLK